MSSAGPPAAKVTHAQAQITRSKVENAVIARRLDRRDSEDKRDRAIASKLGDYDEIVLNTRRRKSDNKTIPEVVAEELRRLRPSGKYISTKFWAELVGEFDLTSPLFGNLPEVDEDADPEQGLIEALLIAQDQSRVLRSSEAFESHLRHCKPVDRTTLLVILQQSRESHVITRAQSRIMCLAILGHIGKHGLQTECIELRDHVRDAMEDILREEIRRLSQKGLQRKFIVAGLDFRLRPFLDMEVMARVEQRITNGTDGDIADDLLKLTDSKIGAELYKNEIGSMRYQFFIRDCDRRIEALEYNDYHSDEIAGSLEELVKHIERQRGWGSPLLFAVVFRRRLSSSSSVVVVGRSS